VGRWSAAAGIATVLVAAGGMLITHPGRDAGGEAAVASTASTAPEAPVQRSIAVLPFADVSPGEDQEYFSDGLTEELVNALGRVPGLRVAARTSSFAFRGRSVPIDTIAKRLRVAYVLEGSVRRSGSRLRISVQLVRADSAYELWSETYEREVKDVFVVQEEIARRVATALQGKLATGERAGPSGPPTGDVMAFELYLKGRYLWNQRTGDALERAVAQFQAAIARDPAYAEAYAGLADAYNLRAAMGFAPGTAVYPLARRAARQALALDATLAGAHAALAFATYMEDADAVAAERGFRRAIELNPSYAPAHQWYSQMMVLTGEGRFEEARREMEHARELDPLSLAIRTDWARDAYFARRYDVAIARLRETLEIDPNYARAHSYLAMVYTQQHRTAAAIAEFRRALDLAGGWWPSRFGQAGLAQAYALAGHRDEAERILGELERSEHYVSPEALALIHTALGDRGAALDALERAGSDRSINAGWLAFDPAWDALRAEPRFVRVLGEMRIRVSVPPPESWIVD
jgi:serine/threonine-protein kinase